MLGEICIFDWVDADGITTRHLSDNKTIALVVGRHCAATQPCVDYTPAFGPAPRQGCVMQKATWGFRISCQTWGESTQQMLVQNSKVLQNINEIGATLAIVSDTGRAGAALALKYWAMIPWRWNEAEGKNWEWNCNFPCICPLKLVQHLTYNSAFNLRILWALFPTHHDHQYSDPQMFFLLLLVPRQRHVNLVSNDMLTTFLVAAQNRRRHLLLADLEKARETVQCSGVHKSTSSPLRFYNFGFHWSSSVSSPVWECRM